PFGDPNLLFDNVDAGHHFRDRMLDLNARIHLHEIETTARAVDDALDGAGILVAGVPAQPHRRVAERGAQRLVDDWGRTFLDELLIAPLDRAIALAQVQHRFAIGEDLHFDVPHVGEIFFDVDRAVAER